MTTPEIRKEIGTLKKKLAMSRRSEARLTVDLALERAVVEALTSLLAGRLPEHDEVVRRVRAGLASQHPEPADEIEHGTTTGYTDRGCRCEACRRANTMACRQQRAERRRLVEGIPVDKHGSASTYNNYGCRCDLCKAAAAARVKGRRDQQRTINSKATT